MGDNTNKDGESFLEEFGGKDSLTSLKSDAASQKISSSSLSNALPTPLGTPRYRKLDDEQDAFLTQMFKIPPTNIPTRENEQHMKFLKQRAQDLEDTKFQELKAEFAQKKYTRSLINHQYFLLSKMLWKN